MSPRTGAALATCLAVAGCFSSREPAEPTAGLCSFEPGEGVPGSTFVVIGGFVFQPAEVRVPAGRRVTWVNCGEEAVAHTSTADEGAWASPSLGPGQAFTRTFPTPGAFSYHCAPHPFMVGRVVVE